MKQQKTETSILFASPLKFFFFFFIFDPEEIAQKIKILNESS